MKNRRYFLKILGATALGACDDPQTCPAPPQTPEAPTPHTPGAPADQLGDTTTDCASTSNPTTNPPPSPIAAGQIADYPPGTLRALHSHSIAIGHDEKGLYALTTICPHRGCDIRGGTINEQGLTCPCHGATFDLNGACLSGPGSQLAHFAIRLDGTAVTVLPSGANTTDRTAVP